MLARAPACGAAHLALVGADVYWTERATGVVKRLSPGGAPTLVAANQPLPSVITADDTAVIWANAGDHAIVVATPGGAAPAPLLTAPDVVHGLLASGGTLYYSAGASTYKVARAGGAPLTLATFATCKTTQPAALAVDADHLYQTDLSSMFITRERLDGAQMVNDPCSMGADASPAKIAAPDTISHSQGELLTDTIAVVAGEVVWADHGNVNAKGVDATTALGAREVAVSASSNIISGFVVSGANVFLSESAEPAPSPTSNTIQVAPFHPGDADATNAKVIAEGQPNARSFAADATHVYWTTHAPSATAGADDDCTIVSLAR